MSAVNIIDQVRELIMRDCLLVMFENIPSRLVPEDANVLRGLKSLLQRSLRHKHVEALDDARFARLRRASRIASPC